MRYRFIFASLFLLVRSYWRILLLYSELLVLAQYIYQIPTNLQCVNERDPLQEKTLLQLKALGLRTQGAYIIPYFLCYLVTLLHIYTFNRIYSRGTKSMYKKSLASSRK